MTVAEPFPPRDTHTRVVCQVKRYAQHREAGAHRAHREPVGLAFFWEHKARGSGLKTTRARRALREYLLTKVAVVLCISNSTSALCDVAEHRWRLRVGPLSPQLTHQR